MPNIANLLKQEIVRLARKEVRAEITSLKKTAATLRAEVSELKRRQQSLEKDLKRQARQAGAPAPAAAEDGPASLRFSAKAFARKRSQLGLSAREVALLLQVSELSVYKWEGGKAKPRAQYLPALAEFMGLGKREAAARLAAQPG